jgi:replication factor C subunit 2/4
MASSSLILPWVEKYRPQKIDDIVQQDEVVNALRSTLTKGDLPHLIFHGPPGTGKTSTAIALCHSLFQSTELRRRVMELNASDERGIAAVRSKIKQFASLAVPPGEVPYKIIILDEADSMTRDAQNALRRVIESFSAITRFVIICNYISKIIDPILSRCAKFRFKPLSHESLVGRLSFIAGNENLAVESDEVYETLVEISGGDLRKAITFLQSASIAGVITKEIVKEISGFPNYDEIGRFFDICIRREPWMIIEEETIRIVLSGYDLSKVLEILCKIVIGSEHLREDVKPALLLKIAIADGAITARADPQIQFLSIAAQINAAG